MHLDTGKIIMLKLVILFYMAQVTGTNKLQVQMYNACINYFCFFSCFCNRVRLVYLNEYEIVFELDSFTSSSRVGSY